jgi:hypothetical protein
LLLSPLGPPAELLLSPLESPVFELFVTSSLGNEEFKKDSLDISRRPKKNINIKIIIYITYNKPIIPILLTIRLQYFIIIFFLA